MKMSSQEYKFLLLIADAVDTYLANVTRKKPEDSGIEKRCEQILPRLVPTYTFHVAIQSSKDPYIMSIRPDIEQLAAKANELFAVLNDAGKNSDEYLQKWAEIKTWELSIDPRILTKRTRLCVDSGRQFAAILCHELGHVFNEDPLMLVRNYREAMLRVSKFEKMMLSRSLIIRKLAMPMFIASESFRVVIEKPEKDKLEIAADAYCPPELRGELASYIERHLLNTPNSYRLLQTEAEYKSEQDTSIQYARGTIDLMRKRRDILKNQIKVQFHSDENDLYTRKLMSFMGKAIGQYDPNTDRMDPVSESNSLEFVERDAEAVVEALLLETIQVTERKVQMLAIDVDGIRTSDDKLYCLQTVYDYMDAIVEEKEKVIKKSGKNAGLSLQVLLDSDPRYPRLVELRNHIMDLKISDTQHKSFGVFIQYPDGYEG